MPACTCVYYCEYVQTEGMNGRPGNEAIVSPHALLQATERWTGDQASCEPVVRWTGDQASYESVVIRNSKIAACVLGKKFWACILFHISMNDLHVPLTFLCPFTASVPPPLILPSSPPSSSLNSSSLHTCTHTHTHTPTLRSNCSISLLACLLETIALEPRGQLCRSSCSSDWWGSCRGMEI